MTIDNDTRGWIMTAVSGVACVFGAAIICVDIPIRRLPRMHDFSITESDAFLSASLSLSFGVMLFSSLYSMLPKSKTYLEDGGFSSRNASYLLIGLFLAGVVGIRVLSNAIHRFIPSHIVDCDHTHDEEADHKHHEEMAEQGRHGTGEEGRGKTHEDGHDHEHEHRHERGRNRNHVDNERAPLLSRTTDLSSHSHLTSSVPPNPSSLENGSAAPPHGRRPSTFGRTLSKIMQGKKQNCDETGPCMGYSDPCGQDCFQVVQRRASGVPHPGVTRTGTWRSALPTDSGRLVTPLPEEEEGSEMNIPGRDEEEGGPRSLPERTNNHKTERAQPKSPSRSRSATHHYHHPEHEHNDASKYTQTRTSTRRASFESHGAQSTAQGQEHHHHVPTNAFMSIGLQTSLAIALHKAPEGFITYATNHANPTLGFAVFMALFIHNITEGFAMSLPLYLALKSRLKAIIWSSFLGGVSQPLGAGVAALWFKVAQSSGHGAPNEAVYGGMFAVTAGVMTSVALSLFSESLQLSHNKGTCIAFAFVGMAILGVSFALTA